MTETTAQEIVPWEDVQDGIRKVPQGWVVDPISGDYVPGPLANIVGEETVRINESGVRPIEFKVLVLPDQSEEEKRLARAGLSMAQESRDRYQMASTNGVIVAMSPLAFTYAEWPEGYELPKIGDRVTFARYAGNTVKGRPFKNEHGREEQQEYRLINDKDIASVLEF